MHHYDAIIVLGRGISPEGVIPESVKSATRKAVELVQKGEASHIIFSGKWSRHFDYTPPSTEAREAANYALELGFPETNIYTEEKSLDTLSNCYYIKTDILIPQNWHSVLLLTMRQNDERAEFLLRKMLGPDYMVDVLSIDFAFKPETLQRLEETEPAKIQRLREFLGDVADGDQEKIMQMHLEYIEKNG
jgi:uncharacterized SAM-binding protein YcdF (DUF218 family)